MLNETSIAQKLESNLLTLIDRLYALVRAHKHLSDVSEVCAMLYRSQTRGWTDGYSIPIRSIGGNINNQATKRYARLNLPAILRDFIRFVVCEQKKGNAQLVQNRCSSSVVNRVRSAAVKCLCLRFLNGRLVIMWRRGGKLGQENVMH